MNGTLVLRRRGMEAANRSGRQRPGGIRGGMFGVPAGKAFSLLAKAGLTAALVLGTSIGLMVLFSVITSHPAFSIRRMEISGNRMVNASAILEQSGLTAGRNIFQVSLEELRDRIDAMEWIRSCRVKRVLPDTVQVTVEEDTAAFLRIDNGVLRYVNAAGEVVARVDAGNFQTLPLLSLDPEAGAQAMQDVNVFFAHLPSGLSPANVDWIRVGKDDIEAGLRGAPRKIVLERDGLESAGQRLDQVLYDLLQRGEEGGVEYIRFFEDKAYVRLGAAPGSEAR